MIEDRGPWSITIFLKLPEGLCRPLGTSGSLRGPLECHQGAHTNVKDTAKKKTTTVCGGINTKGAGAKTGDESPREKERD